MLMANSPAILLRIDQYRSETIECHNPLSNRAQSHLEPTTPRLHPTDLRIGSCRNPQHIGPPFLVHLYLVTVV